MIAVAASLRVRNLVRVRVAEHSTDAGDFVALVLADDDVNRDAMVFGSYHDVHKIALEAVANGYGRLPDRFWVQEVVTEQPLPVPSSSQDRP